MNIIYTHTHEQAYQHGELARTMLKKELPVYITRDALKSMGVYVGHLKAPILLSRGEERGILGRVVIAMLGASPKDRRLGKRLDASDGLEILFDREIGGDRACVLLCVRGES